MGVGELGSQQRDEAVMSARGDGGDLSTTIGMVGREGGLVAQGASREGGKWNLVETEAQQHAILIVGDGQGWASRKGGEPSGVAAVDGQGGSGW